MRIQIKDAAFRYEGGDLLFSGLNAELPSGAVLSIVGPNGCGKTTFLKSLIGLQRFSRGEVWLDGRDASDDRSRSRHFGYVPQNVSSAVGYAVSTMVILGRSRFMKTFSRPSELDFAKAQEALERVGVAGFADRAFSSLSGGERQLVLIARALATESRILVFDEPTSALDLVNQHKTIRLLRSLSRDMGFSVVFTTHDPSHALHISDSTLLMCRGKTPRFGPASCILTEENIRGVFGVDVRIVDLQVNGRSTRGVVPVLEACDA